jgi:non-specific serine/threonine protein kinase
MTDGSTVFPAAITAKYHLLPPDLQRLARRLAVFRNGFDLPAVAVVASVGETGVEQSGVPATPSALTWQHRLNRLADHGLLQAHPAPDTHRFVLPEPIRAFLWARMVDTGDVATIRRAHAAYFLALAERTRPLLFTPGFRQAMATLTTDQDNFRAALAWMDEAGETGLRLRLCVALWEFWYQCGFVAEGRAAVEAALGTDGGTPLERHFALALAGFLAWLQGDTAQATRRTLEARAIAEALGNPWLAATSDNGLALIAWQTGDTAAMRRAAEAALPVVRDAGDRIAEAIALVALAIADRLDGRREEAGARFDEASRLAEQTGFRWLAAAARFGAGEVALDQGRELDALGHYQMSLAVTAELGDAWGMGAAVGGIACVATTRGLVEEAARLFGAADGLLAVGHTFLPTLDRARYESSKTSVQDRVGRRAFARLSGEGRARSPGEAATQALALARLLAGSPKPGDSGEPHAPQEAGTRPEPAPESPVQLTSREREVVGLVAAGASNAEIARALDLSPNTVRSYVADIRRKLGLPNRAALAAYAERHRIA